MKLFTYQSSIFQRFVFLAFAVLIFTNAAFAQTAGKPAIGEQAAMVTELDVNGLKVLIKRRPNAPTVSAGLFIRGGARNINEKNAGIESLTLGVATEASKKFPRETLRRELARTGSSIGSGSNNDYSVLSLATTRQNFDRSWEIFTDIALNPSFAQADLDQVRGRTITGLREQETNSDNFLQILQDRIVYANHPYSNDVNGTVETLSRFTVKDLQDYHRQLMQTSRLLLVVVGDVDAKELQNRVAATLGKLSKGDYKEQTLPPLDFSKPTVDVTARNIPTNYIQGVFNAPSLSSPDFYAMRVAITVLQSRVYQEVRVRRQLSYAPNAELASFAANTGNIYVTAVDANQAVSVMLNEINRLKTSLIDPEDISGISGHFLTLYYIDQQTNAAQALELAKYELIGGDWRKAFNFLERILEVTPEQVRAAAQKYMRNIRFIVIGNPSAIDREIFLKN